MKTEAPAIVKTPHNNMHESTETHPAYAQIGASRVNGHANLYGSDFTHNGYVVIRIGDSRLHRSLHSDWHHSSKEYIEVALSEAQWATFVSTLNMGQGVTCTLQSKDGYSVPGISHPPQRKDQFTAEMAAQLAQVRLEVKKLRAQIEDSKLSVAGKSTILSTLIQVEHGVGSNLDFAAKSFTEHVETVTEHAKIEVAAYAQGVLTRLGMDALRGKLPIELGDGKDGE